MNKTKCPKQSMMGIWEEKKKRTGAPEIGLHNEFRLKNKLQKNQKQNLGQLKQVMPSWGSNLSHIKDLG